jgi:hypothetical protein
VDNCLFEPLDHSCLDNCLFEPLDHIPTGATTVVFGLYLFFENSV